MPLYRHYNDTMEIYSFHWFSREIFAHVTSMRTHFSAVSTAGHARLGCVVARVSFFKLPVCEVHVLVAIDKSPRYRTCKRPDCKSTS